MISLSHQMPAGGNPQKFWQHVVGLVLIEMKKRGWTGGKFITATWRDKVLTLSVGPGSQKISAEKLAEFMRTERTKGKRA